ncbi:Aste57867_98 [Aphanomyces stellatus]|uniref:Aste57867_98 protein n=1 Tax=Aphanomyces stellatus TaxID=120398 RepID=A0A485K1R5_9STRA|nr:hypothetical protein As57867_000098 [Aphanomyces stellatus]VFT77324.1 Aste57867_98 [Aphanomyces stellatus]
MSSSPPPLPLVSPGNASHHFFRLVHPFIGLAGVVDLRMSYLAWTNPFLHHQMHHVSSHFLEGFAGITWAVGGLLQYEVEAPKFIRRAKSPPSAASILSFVNDHKHDAAFRASRRLYLASAAGLVGLTCHHAAFAYLAQRRHDSKRVSAHVAAGASAASYAYLWHSIFLGPKRMHGMGVSHMAATAVMLTVWLTESDKILKQYS